MNMVICYKWDFEFMCFCIYSLPVVITVEPRNLTIMTCETNEWCLRFLSVSFMHLSIPISVDQRWWEKALHFNFLMTLNYSLAYPRSSSWERWFLSIWCCDWWYLNQCNCWISTHIKYCIILCLLAAEIQRCLSSSVIPFPFIGLFVHGEIPCIFLLLQISLVLILLLIVSVWLAR